MPEAKEICLAPLKEEDIPTLFGWINDRQLVLANAPYRPVSEAAHAAWFRSTAQRPDAVFFGIRLTDGDRLIGTCQLHSIHSIHRSAELQMRVDPSFHRQGYGMAALGLLLDFAFADLNLHRVNLHVFANNAAAIGLYEKAGFVQEGVLRQAAFIDGKFVDIVAMGILRPSHTGGDR